MSAKTSSTKMKAAAIVIIILIAAIGVYAYYAKLGQETQPIVVSTTTNASETSETMTSIAQGTHSNLIVSTTTSLYETGFLDYCKTNFESRYPQINVSFISQGTGLAIQTAMRGDADMIMVHSPSQELPFLTSGYGVNRKIFAYNFFVIVGPTNDPAHIKGLDTMSALRQIKIYADAGYASWISRGDNSGTYTKEKSLWMTAGYSIATLGQQAWYFSAGAGMTQTLKMADEKMAYTITDSASYLNNYVNGNIKLVALVQADPDHKVGYDLLNVYSVIACDPRNPNLGKANYAASMTFIKYLTSDDGQALFENFGKDKFGQSIFKPAVKLLKTDTNSTMAKWIKKYAMDPFGGSECPTKYRYQEGDLYMMTAPLLQKYELLEALCS
jgi:tungstate transport system substrate-binding protein